MQDPDSRQISRNKEGWYTEWAMEFAYISKK